MVTYLQHVVPREYRDEGHVRNRDAGTEHPGPEVPRLEPVLLRGARVHKEQPETELWNAASVEGRATRMTTYPRDG